jgi:hypothetical protein
MKNLKTLMVCAGAVVAVSSAAFGQGLTVRGSSGLEGSSTPGWQAFPTVLNDYANASRPFWDQRSMDGGNRNVGNYLSGTYTPGLPGGALASPNVRPAWWGYSSLVNMTEPAGSRNADTSWSFDQVGTVPVNGAGLALEVAGLKNFNEVGWYDASLPVGSEVLNVLFTGGANAPAVASFAPTARWGLYLRSWNGTTESAGQGRIFFTQSERSRTVTGSGSTALDRNHQHFALFARDLSEGNQFYSVGIEDLPRSATGVEEPGDYNDVVLHIGTGANRVPAPGAAVILGVGGLLAGRRRR